MKRVLLLVAMCGLIAGLTSLSANAATPLRWTPKQAATIGHATCKGLGAGVAGRFVAFKCVSESGVPFWGRMRPDGRKLCWSRDSLAAIPPTCLIVAGHGGPVLGTADGSALAMGRAIQKHFDGVGAFPWQAHLPSCTRTAATVFSCSINVPELQAAGTVTWNGTVPTAALTSFVTP